MSSVKTISYSTEYIERVKNALPNHKMLHWALEQSDGGVGRLLAEVCETAEIDPQFILDNLKHNPEAVEKRAEWVLEVHALMNEWEDTYKPSSFVR